VQTGIVVFLALVADHWFGEIRHGHPLTAFGRVSGRLERAWNRRRLPDWLRCGLGVLAVGVLVVPVAVVIGWLSRTGPYGLAIDVVVLYLAVGLRSLGDHARRVQRALAAEDIDEARAAVGMIVSRDTRALDARRAAAATVESVLENGNDAVLGALFWYLVGGAGGVVAYRLVNTLDAMWGYRTARLEKFGWAAARLDDVLNWIPARLAALTYGLCAGRPLAAWRCVRLQGLRAESPNAGVVMAAGAGALGVRVGGPSVYHGRLRWRPRFGVGRAPAAEAIDRAIRLVQGGALAWTAIVLLTGYALA